MLFRSLWRRLTGLDVQAARVKMIYMGQDAKFDLGETRTIDIFEVWHDELEEELIDWAWARWDEIKWRQTMMNFHEAHYNAWPQLDGSMERQYICSRCDFKKLCEARPSARKGLIELHYQPKEGR